MKSYRYWWSAHQPQNIPTPLGVIKRR